MLSFLPDKGLRGQIRVIFLQKNFGDNAP